MAIKYMHSFWLLTCANCVKTMAQCLQGTSVTAMGTMEFTRTLCWWLSVLSGCHYRLPWGRDEGYHYNLKMPHSSRITETPVHFRPADVVEGNNNSFMYISQFTNTRNVFPLIAVSATVSKTLYRWGSNNNGNSDRNDDDVGLWYLGKDEYDYDLNV